MADDEKIEVILDGEQRANVAEKAEEAQEYLAGFLDFHIEDDDDLSVAVDCLKDVKRTHKQIKAEQELATKPMNAALNQVRSWFRPALDTLTKTEALLKSKVEAYHRLVEERSRAAMEAAAEASREGNFDAAHEASKGIVQAPGSKGVSVGQRTWDYELEDLALVPRDFLALDHSAVKIYLKNCGTENPEPIPGLRFVPKAGTVVVRT